MRTQAKRCSTGFSMSTVSGVAFENFDMPDRYQDKLNPDPYCFLRLGLSRIWNNSQQIKFRKVGRETATAVARPTKGYMFPSSLSRIFGETTWIFRAKIYWQKNRRPLETHPNFYCRSIMGKTLIGALTLSSLKTLPKNIFFRLCSTISWSWSNRLKIDI